MKSKIQKSQIFKKGILLILILAIIMPSATVYATLDDLLLKESTVVEKVMYGEIGSIVKKIEEHFKSNTTLYIVNENQLRALAAYVDNGNSCYGKKIELLNDIELNPDMDWEPIGNIANQFSGTFDGNGYSIFNLTYKVDKYYQTAAGYACIGLFGVVSDRGTVKNVNVLYSNITTDETNIQLAECGNIVGRNYGLVLNCSADNMPCNIPEVEVGTPANNNIGLIVGLNKGKIENTSGEQQSTKIPLEDGSELNIDVNVYKNDSFITDFSKATTFKIGERIRLEFFIDTYLYTGLEDGREIKLWDDVSKENYPKVSIGNCILEPVSAMQEEVEVEEGVNKPRTTLTYEYEVNEEDKVEAYGDDDLIMDFQKNMKDENLYVYYSNHPQNFNTGDKLIENGVFSDLKLFINSTMPYVISEAYVVEASESRRYAEGTEIRIKLTSNERIKETIAPEVLVYFYNSGLGKYNYQEDTSKGNAMHIDAVIDEEGKTTWTYSYVIQPGDEGVLQIKYLPLYLVDTVDNINDIGYGGKEIKSNIYADTTAPKVEIVAKDVESSITNKDTVKYEFIWNEAPESFTEDNIIVNNGIRGKLVKSNDTEFENRFAKFKSAADFNGDGKINIEECDELLHIVEEFLINQEEKEEPEKEESGLEKPEGENKEEPEVDLTYDLNSDKIVDDNDLELIVEYMNHIYSGRDKGSKYTMDVTTDVENGNVENLQVIVEANECQDSVGHKNVRAENIIRIDKKSPVLGSLAAHVESQIKLSDEVDLIKEHYKIGEEIKVVATFDENITIKEETKLPELVLKFSESGNSVKPEGFIEGNKIIYTYIISEGDKGTLTVRSFSGQVMDIAGNSIEVTRKTLDGDNIIVDTEKPKLEFNVVNEDGTYGEGKEIIIEAKYDSEVYILDNIFNENEIKLVDINTIIELPVEEDDEENLYTNNIIENVVEDNEGNLYVNNIIEEGKSEEEKEKVYIIGNAPVLKINFGYGPERDTTVLGYGTKEDGSIDRTKILYKYVIVAEETRILEVDGEEVEETVLGDNGELSILSYINKENLEVCDIAGNIAESTNELKDKIVADTEKPLVNDVTGVVAEPYISNSGIYHKAGSKVDITLKFNELITAVEEVPEVLIGFSEEYGTEPSQYYPYLCEKEEPEGEQPEGEKPEGEKPEGEQPEGEQPEEEKPEGEQPEEEKPEGEETEREEPEGEKPEEEKPNKIEYTDTIKFTYTIEDGNNGYLWIKVPTNQFIDKAGNKNNITEYGFEIRDVFADTIAPNKNSGLQWDIDYITNSEGQATGIRAEAIFDEKIFDLENNNLVELTKAPLVGIFIDNKLQKTVEASDIITTADNKTRLVYVTEIESDIDMDGIISVNLINGTLYDKAGNKWSLELDGDTLSPVFKDIKILTENGVYKAGKTIEIVARFEEKTKLDSAPDLTIRIGKDIKKLTALYNVEDKENTDNIKVARYSYEISDSDNGALNIISLIGKVSDGVRERDISQIYIDTTEKEEKNNQATENGENESNKENVVNGKPEELLNYSNEKYANNEEKDSNIIIDNIKPYVEKIQVYSNGQKYDVYTKEEGKEAVKNDIRTNDNEIEYVLTYSESLLENFDKTKIEITNGIIDKENITIVNDREIKIKVNITTEGVQSLVIHKGAGTDKAQNVNDLERFNIVTTDFTKPIVRFISEYNGGLYVLPTNIGKVEIRPSIETSEEISKVEYAWNEEEYKVINNYSTSSDIVVPTKAFSEAGTYVLNVRVTDLAGNITQTSKTYEIKNSKIDIKLNTENYTKENVTATVTFGEGLTDNRSVKFKAEESNDIIELNAIGLDQNGNAQYLIYQNGTIYAEATDKVKNKVFVEFMVTIIDEEKFAIDIIGNPEEWTNEDVRLDVYAYGDIKSLTVEQIKDANETTTTSAQNILEDMYYIAKENGDYKFVAKDKFGNPIEKIVKVTKIDKSIPEITEEPKISKLQDSERAITIMAEDTGSGIAEYAITSTTESPIKWSESYVIKVTHDGAFYVWVKDNAGNIKRSEKPVIVDMTAPTIRFDYTVLTVEAGMPINVVINTNENSTISYSWDGKTWINSEELLTTVKVPTYKPEITGKYILFAKAVDKSGNVSEAQIEFTVVKQEEILDPQIVFEGLYTTQIDGVHYVKVSDAMTAEDITNKMDKTALCNLNPEYTKLTEDGKVKTGSEITLNGETKYVVVVKGDINSDGNAADFITDIIALNRYRIKNTGLTVAQVLAGDINDDGVIDFIDDIMKINRYRIGIISNL